MDNVNSNSRRLPPLEQDNQNFRAMSQQRNTIKQQMISSNNFEPKTSLQNKKTGPAPIEQLDNFICYFCGGQDCKKEQAISNKNKNAIDGLHSDWITDDILAMQRLSMRLMPIVIPQFQQHNIGAVINLQQQGEHAQCGPGIIPGIGFSYNPESLQSAKINFFNYGWEDMTADTTFENLLKICSAFDLMQKKGKKVAVHCHAGTGRTGVAIVAWLIYGERMSADDAIRLFQSRRRDSLGKGAQKDLLKAFEKFLQNRKWYNYTKISGLINDDIVQQQNQYVVNELKNKTKLIPAPLYVIFNRFLLLLEDQLLTSKQILQAFIGDPQNIQPVNKEELQNLQKQFDVHNFRIGHVTDMRLLAQLLFVYFDFLPWQCVSDKFALEIKQNLNVKQILEILKVCFKDLEIGSFYILKTVVQFAVQLKIADPQIDLKIFFYRFSISLLQKQRYLDDHFIGHSLVRTNKIEIVQIVYLQQFLQKWHDEILNLNEKIFEENQLSKDFRELKGV
ncbi:unnamed protein product [Paramecium pentaurelia]|uniref:Tyrosine specific protein phosphatases domain-containing protein n=1 Tax=Paramecium pentaurelia TaxID=43138 RepID=A0A8S1UN88_9CILI|nr:unnamed protein product [Paramecium pentaurelia]